MVDNTHLFLYWNTLVFLTATPVTYIQGATDADRSERAEHLEGVKQNLTFISFDIPELDRCLVLKLVLTNITAIYHYYLACNTSQSAIHIRVFGRQFCLRTLPSNTSKSGVYRYYKLTTTFCCRLRCAIFEFGCSFYGHGWKSVFRITNVHFNPNVP